MVILSKPQNNSSKEVFDIATDQISSCAIIELWMHLGGLLSTQEARVPLGELLGFLRSLQPRVLPCLDGCTLRVYHFLSFFLPFLKLKKCIKRLKELFLKITRCSALCRCKDCHYGDLKVPRLRLREIELRSYFIPLRSHIFTAEI